MTRNRRQPDRLAGGGGTLINVDEALADWDDDLGAEETVSDGEEDEELLAQGGGRAAKAARRGWGRRAAAEPKPLDPTSFSDLLAAAPRLVDLLLEEDKVRSITLVARDACNLAIAGGGRISVMPVWNALAARFRVKEAAELKAKQAAEEMEAADEAAIAAAVAAAAAAARSPGAPAMQPQPPAEAPPPAEPKGRRMRRGRGRQPRPPPPPSDLDVVQAAVARDPARENQVKKTEQQWQFRLSTKDLQGIEQHRSRCLMVRELDIRAAAHRKWGDEAQMEEVRRVAAQRAERRQEAWQKREAEELAARKEELALRVAEADLPAVLAENPLSHGHTEGHYSLSNYLRYGTRYWGIINLDEVLEPIITAHREKAGREERQRLLDEALAESGHLFFKQSWQYRSFISSGVADGLHALLAVAARQAGARQEAMERERELDERLEAVGLSRSALVSMTATTWLQTGEGDIEGMVDRARARAERELELSEALRANGLLYLQRDPRCSDYTWGLREGQTALQVMCRV
ncbi:hypothetical protein ABPG75_007238 [Micractinium tetrahymenae]